ncbi:MAG TPA: class I SAM-dependent methyltransferase [Anaerolineae bacterium]|nr:class I SAM-dependent methyltransferase [Anaerolineae bacterium]
MTHESDRERWNRKYSAGEGPAHFSPKEFLVEHAHLLPDGGQALDVASGFGGNALWLAERGFHVDAVDVSDVAVEKARAEAERRGLAERIRCIQADVEEWPVPPARYDVILVFFYLNRGLMPRLAAGLRPGGLLFEANRNRRYLEERPDFDPNYLLEPGELRRLAEEAGLAIVRYTDGTPDDPYAVRLIARA